MVDKGTEKKIGVFLAERTQEGRAKTRATLRRDQSIFIAGEASTREELLEAVRKHCPDIILLDSAIPGLDSPAALNEFRNLCPGTKLVLLSESDNPEDVLPALQNGIHGYVLDGVGRQDLVEAIEAIMQGGAFFSPSISRLLLNEYLQCSKAPERSDVDLSPRERQVLQSIVNGKTNKETAVDLGLGVRTIETHRERVMRKLKARNTAELTKIAVKGNLL